MAAAAAAAASDQSKDRKIDWKQMYESAVTCISLAESVIGGSEGAGRTIKRAGYCDACYAKETSCICVRCDECDELINTGDCSCDDDKGVKRKLSNATSETKLALSVLKKQFSEMVGKHTSSDADRLQTDIEAHQMAINIHLACDHVEDSDVSVLVPIEWFRNAPGIHSVVKTAINRFESMKCDIQPESEVFVAVSADSATKNEIRDGEYELSDDQRLFINGVEQVEFEVKNPGKITELLEDSLKRIEADCRGYTSMDPTKRQKDVGFDDIEIWHGDDYNEFNATIYVPVKCQWISNPTPNKTKKIKPNETESLVKNN